jgi:MerR family transcriptional regulator, redox-sensitive transcriptional activator SoxR
MLTIGQVAARAGVNPSRIRYYEEVGVLPEPERVSGRRRYDEGILQRLSVIDTAQRAGMSLDEIRDLPGPGERLRDLADRKLPAVDALIARAEAVRRWLELARGCECASADVCGLFSDAALIPPRA